MGFKDYRFTAGAVLVAGALVATFYKPAQEGLEASYNKDAQSYSVPSQYEVEEAIAAIEEDPVGASDYDRDVLVRHAVGQTEAEMSDQRRVKSHVLPVFGSLVLLAGAAFAGRKLDDLTGDAVDLDLEVTAAEPKEAEPVREVNFGLPADLDKPAYWRKQEAASAPVAPTQG